MANNIGERIKLIRKNKGLSQKDFAKKLNLTQGFLSNIEKGRHNPTAEVLNRIANTCDINGHWLLTGEGNMFKEEGSVLGTRVTNATVHKDKVVLYSEGKEKLNLAEPPGPEWDAERKNLYRKPNFQHLCNLLTKIPSKTQDKIMEKFINEAEVVIYISDHKDET